MNCHYTTMDACLNILNSIKKADDGKLYMTFWASSILYMNDPQEFIYGFNNIWPIIKKFERDMRVNEEQRITNLWKDKHYNKNDMDLNGLLLQSLSEEEELPYLISFSTVMDSLPLWNMYADNGNGVCLELNDLEIKDKKVIKIGNIYFQEVQYGNLMGNEKINDDIRYFYDEYLNTQKRENDLSDFKLSFYVVMCKYVSTHIKKKTYEFEHEVRVSQDKKDNEEIKFRCNKKGNIIPYIEIPLPVDYLKCIRIGPTCDFNSTKRALQTKLKQMGVNNVRIEKSNIQYRNY